MPEPTLITTADTGSTEGKIPLLGAGGKLASSLLPTLSLTDFIPVADQAERLLLVSADTYGKLVKQADTGRIYGLPNGNDAAVNGDWLDLGDSLITAADISDSTAAGRALLMAADAAAQIAALGAETPAGATAKVNVEATARDTGDTTLPQNAVAGDAYTLLLTDAGKIIWRSHATAQTLTVPPDPTVVWVADTFVPVLNEGPGDLTLTQGAGVTLTGTVLMVSGDSRTLLRTALNAWRII